MAAGSSATTQDKLLRRVYERRWRRQFSSKSILLQTLARNERSFAEGEHVSVAAHTNLGGAVRWSKTNLLPTPDHEHVDRFTFNYRMLSTIIEIDGTFIDRAKSKGSAELQPLTWELDSKLRLARLTKNWHLYRDGSALLATPAGATAANTFTVDSVAGLRTGMKVDLLKQTTGAPDAGGFVSGYISINKDGNVVTIQAPTTMADYNDVQSNPTDYGVYLAGSYCSAPFGLAAIIDTGNPPANVGNYGGLDRTDNNNSWARGVVHDAGGTPRVPTNLLMQNVIDDIEANSDGEIDEILCPPSLWSAIVNDLVDQKRYGTLMTLNGWATAIKWGDRYVVRDHHCQPDRMYFLDRSTFVIYQNDEGKWMDKDGAILSRKEGAVAYIAAWYQMMQLVCYAPGANGVLADLKQS